MKLQDFILTILEVYLTRLYLLIAIVVLAIIPLAAISQAPEGLEAIGADSDCFACHGDKKLTKEFEGGKKVSLYVDKQQWQKSAHASMGCQNCHGQTPHMPADEVDTPAKWTNYETGMAQSCGGCHPDAQQAFVGSIHATSNNPNIPGDCTGCHEPHAAGLTTKTKRESVKICAGCHKHPAETYFLSIHGQNLNLGNEKVAACFDCHGYHNVKSVKTFTNAKVAAICSKCHEGATARTVSGWYSHTPITPVQNLIMSAVRLFYIIIIPLTLASMIAHQFLKHRRTMERRRASEEGTE